jgi:AbiTii
VRPALSTVPRGKKASAEQRAQDRPDKHKSDARVCTVSLIDEIIQLAVDDKSQISTLLRSCLVLAYSLDNAKLKSWVDSELNGYAHTDEIPDYRKVPAMAQGFFVGMGGVQINNQPLPPAALKEEHRHFAETAILPLPIAAYDLAQHGTIEKTNPIIPWPPNLTVFYQTKFFKGYVLNRAWQEIAPSCFIALLDTIRNRTLRFALELQKELGLVSDNFSALPNEKVDQYVMNIYGGNVVIGGHAHDIKQVGNIIIAKNNFPALEAALKSFGIAEPDITELKAALDHDAAAQQGACPSIGQRTGDWLKSAASKIASAGTKTGGEVLTAWILQYLGLS